MLIIRITLATAEYLSRPERKIRTLFATHYHEMTQLEDTTKGIRNLNVDVAEENGDVIFLHKIVSGSASRSYGIHVAKIAGAPTELLTNAQNRLEMLENNSKNNMSIDVGKEANNSKIESESQTEEYQVSLFDFAPNPVIERLKSVDLMDTTPSQALAILEELKEYL